MRGLILDLNRNSPIVCFQDPSNTVIHIRVFGPSDVCTYLIRNASNMQTELPSGLNFYFSLSLPLTPFLSIRAGEAMLRREVPQSHLSAGQLYSKTCLKPPLSKRPKWVT